MNRFIIALLMLIAPATAQAADMVSYGFKNGWYIGQGESDCAMNSKYGDSMLFISYDDRLKSVTVAFGDPSIKSLKEGDEKKLDTYFLKDGSTSLDDGWKDKTFTVIKIDGVLYFHRVMDDEFLTDLARYNKMGFFYNEILLRSYNLDGTAEAVTMLKQCAHKVSMINPSDPFK
jgi:hypothetical protein